MSLPLQQTHLSATTVRPKKHHLVLLFLIGAAALQAAIEWDKVQRITRSAYEFVEAVATNKMIYSESRVEYLLQPLRQESEALKLTARKGPTCTCEATLPRAKIEWRRPNEPRYSIDPPTKR